MPAPWRRYGEKPGGLDRSRSRRSAACRPGRGSSRANGVENDLLYVSGTIGDAALGLRLRGLPPPDWGHALTAEAQVFLRERYLLPQPRLGLRAALLASAHAAMDISDGLAGDLGKMLRASGLTAAIAVADIPLSAAAREAVRQDPALIETILTGGDDYEILSRRAAGPGGGF